VTDFSGFCNKLSGLITARNILPLRVTVTVGIVRDLLMNEKVVFLRIRCEHELPVYYRSTGCRCGVSHKLCSVDELTVLAPVVS
jgi:hypothetical protein